MKIGGQIQWNAIYTYLRNVQDLLVDGKDTSWKTIRRTMQRRRKIKQHSSHLRKIGACLRHHSAEMETLTTSRSSTTVITANGEVQTHGEATVYVKELDILDNESLRGYASSFIARKALR